MSTIEQAETLPAGTWQVDTVHSHVRFAVDYIVGTFHGSVSPVEATLVVDEGWATLTGSAAVSAIRVEDESLAGHLASPDFFDAERTPEITFRSTAIERRSSDLRVLGALTIRGTSQPIELAGSIGEPVVDAYGRTLVSLKLAATVDRTAFGLNWNNPLPSGEPALANDVILTAELYLVRA